MSCVRWIALSCGIGALALVGCATGPAPRGLDDPDPAVRITTIKAIADRQDRSQTERLIELLDDRDPAVRMSASQALRELTGKSLGMSYSDDPEARRAVRRQWREALQLPVERDPNDLTIDP